MRTRFCRHVCPRNLTFFDELGVLRLIFNLGEQELEDYYEENLGPLEKYDKEHNTNLLETLAVYLYASGDYNQAAMNMFVHVNTLRYRLKKVEEILGQDLRQLAVLVNLYTALQVKVMLGR
ncbi:PucR family transcriptional regulator [Moorella sulfitireducens]|uniref:PucR family transcriptional regulator n=1 Tax=Neomoorella sulfitireducens TaxID=2972948 RepID=UPI0021ABE9A8|nr:helix-turn-helix domain-containing protein [Moorella sulfitireducens]